MCVIRCVFDHYIVRSQCTACEYTSSQASHLTVHMRTHSGEKPYAVRADMCGFASRLAVGAVYHGMIVQCLDCPKAFTVRSALTDHIRRAHTGEKPYACDACEYSCATSSELARHKRSKAHMQAVAAVEDASLHTGVCVHCGLCFTVNSGCILCGCWRCYFVLGM